MPIFSIVIPIYNVEKYVSYCIDSVRRQSFRDIEILCVDDGSFDRSSQIADLHASLDSRVRVIHKTNGGLSSARNAGIAEASGDYIVFVDSDDYLEKNACAILYEKFLQGRFDIVTFGANCIPTVDSYPWLANCLSPRDATYAGFSSDLLFKENSRPYAWRTAVRRTFLIENNLLFNEAIRFGEDQVFHFEAYPLANNTALISDKLYNYRVLRSGSLMGDFAQDVKTRVFEHLRIVEAILKAWASRGFLDLCPLELLDWILDFLFVDIHQMPQEDRERAFDHLRDMLNATCPDLILQANRLPTICKRIYAEINMPTEKRSISRSVVWRYVAYRMGLKAYVTGTLRRPFRAIFSRVRRVMPVMSSGLEWRNGGLLEKLEGEEDLTRSLELLILEHRSKKTGE